jgi:hypothetical protein
MKRLLTRSDKGLHEHLILDYEMIFWSAVRTEDRGIRRELRTGCLMSLSSGGTHGAVNQGMFSVSLQGWEDSMLL